MGDALGDDDGTMVGDALGLPLGLVLGLALGLTLGLTLGLLIAYAERYVKPVCSDFDTFTVGSKARRLRWTAWPAAVQAAALAFPL